uniref:START domain-containing protein n=1 Tax=Coccolithus braarudii TaxID=221442 RepID=A0A7S0L9Y4_9EUKA|mmetsp:Transcript_23351/g.50395  ORF Transcript_23351/g.50395 Transcript_23351/m.50395 type:complete len:286 (+) Transcript_23351:40-897(+)
MRACTESVAARKHSTGEGVRLQHYIPSAGSLVRWLAVVTAVLCFLLIAVAVCADKSEVESENVGQGAVKSAVASAARADTSNTASAARKGGVKSEGEDEGWSIFRQEKIADGAYVAFEANINGLPFVTVNATNVDVPAKTLIDIFLDESMAHKWNDYMGTVRHLGNNVQLQTYKLPWPFTAREYLMRCSDDDLQGGRGHRTRCVPVEGGHPQAPLRNDRVRGSCETLWQISPSATDSKRRSDLYFRGHVDPGGALPKWIVNEIGKHGSANVVASLIKLGASRRRR